MGWSRDQAKQFVRRVKDRAGAGWHLLGHHLQEALIDAECLSVACGQDDSITIKPTELVELRRAMYEIAKISLEG